MPKMFMPLGKMNLERGAMDGDHAWVIKDLMATSHGYEQFPVLSSAATASVDSATNPKGGFGWRGAGTARMYVGTTGRIYEVANTTFTNVSRTSGGSYDNDTNGPSFAAYGNKCYHSNGVDRINSINVPAATGGSTNFSNITYTSNGAVIAPKFICSHKNHLVAAGIVMLEGYGEIDSADVTPGIGFTNQPAGDDVEVLSSDAGDTTQIVTIKGTLNGTDTVTSVNVNLNGLTAVSTSGTSWGKILRVTCNAANAGNITIREKSGGLPIATIPISAVASHVGNAVVSIAAGDTYVTIVGDSATTAQIGIEGTDPEGVTIYDSQALSGTTTVHSNLKFRTVTAIYKGDLEVARTVTITSHQFGMGDTYDHLIWISGTDLPEGYGDPQVAPQILGSDYRYLFDGIGTITGVIDGGDCFFVFKSGSIYRLDGPPFQPTVINYNIGMRPGNTPYRSGDRIYFWSSKGLSYIDIRSNEVVHVFEDSMQRAVLDGGSGGNGTYIGLFPQQNISTVEDVSAGVSSLRVSIAGDPEYNLLFVTYWTGTNCYGSDDSTVLCYNERLDSFSLLNGPVGLNSTASLILDYNNDSQLSFPGSVIRIFRNTNSGASTLTMYSFGSLGLVGLTGTACPYIRYPFKSVDPESSRSRILRVRPVLDNISTLGDEATTAGTGIEVLSISGMASGWTTSSSLSVGANSYSKDGWFSIDNCQFADKHSIGVHFKATKAGTQTVNELVIGGLIGIEVEFELMPSRSL